MYGKTSMGLWGGGPNSLHILGHLGPSSGDIDTHKVFHIVLLGSVIHEVVSFCQLSGLGCKCLQFPSNVMCVFAVSNFQFRETRFHWVCRGANVYCKLISGEPRTYRCYRRHGSRCAHTGCLNEKVSCLFEDTTLSTTVMFFFSLEMFGFERPPPEG